MKTICNTCKLEYMLVPEDSTCMVCGSSLDKFKDIVIPDSKDKYVQLNVCLQPVIHGAPCQDTSQ